MFRKKYFHLFDLNGIKCWVHFDNAVAFFDYVSLTEKKTSMIFLCEMSFFYSGVSLVGTSLYSPHYWVNISVSFGAIS